MNLFITKYLDMALTNETHTSKTKICFDLFNKLLIDTNVSTSLSSMKPID